MLKRKFFSDRQIADYNRDGFLIVPGMFDARAMKDITAWTEAVQNLPETPGKHMMYFEKSLRDGSRVLNRIENFYPYHEGFHRLFDSDSMAGRASELFGEPAVLFKEKINFKMPGGDGFKAHQDQQAGWDTYGKLFLTVMVTIDETNVENGCLELVAGHHKRGLVGELWKPMTPEQTKGMAFKPYPTKPGDVAFFDSYAPHASEPNGTDSPRRVLYITYGRLSEGDHRVQYYADKRKNYPPDCEREPGKQYAYKV